MWCVYINNKKKLFFLHFTNYSLHTTEYNLNSIFIYVIRFVLSFRYRVEFLHCIVYIMLYRMVLLTKSSSQCKCNKYYTFESIEFELCKSCEINKRVGAFFFPHKFWITFIKPHVVSHHLHNKWWGSFYFFQFYS